MTHLCAVCARRPVPDMAFIDPDCGRQLVARLESMHDVVTPPRMVHRAGVLVPASDGAKVTPGLLSALDDVIRRQVRFAAAAGPRSDEMPLPYNPAAVEARTVLVGTLTFWAGSVAEIRGLQMPDGPLAAATFLADQVGWLRAQQAGPDAFDELTAAIVQARQVTDRPADKRYVGPCVALVNRTPDGTTTDLRIPWAVVECGADLYAREHGDEVTCRDCGAAYPVDKRRDWLLEQAADRLLPAAEMARAVDGLGVPVSASTIASWKRRKRITVHPGPHGEDLYRVGDVRELVEAGARRRGDVAV